MLGFKYKSIHMPTISEFHTFDLLWRDGHDRFVHHLPFIFYASYSVILSLAYSTILSSYFTEGWPWSHNINLTHLYFLFSANYLMFSANKQINYECCHWLLYSTSCSISLSRYVKFLLNISVIFTIHPVHTKKQLSIFYLQLEGWVFNFHIMFMSILS